MVVRVALVVETLFSADLYRGKFFYTPLPDQYPILAAVFLSTIQGHRALQCRLTKLVSLLYFGATQYWRLYWSIGRAERG